MNLAPRRIVRSASHAGAFVQNALEVARFGGLKTGEEPAPYEVVAEDRVHRLRRYLADGTAVGERPVLLLVPPMMLAAEVYDVSPATSAVRQLAAHGVEPWVVDFGAPEKIEGGLTRTLADHVLAVSRAVDTAVELAGRDVHLGGYSQGGMFCYQAAAYRRSEGLASLVTFGSPVDTREAVPFGLPRDVVTKGAAALADALFADRSLPAWMSRTGFKLLDPAKAVRQRIDFLLQLHNRAALLEREGQRRFLEEEGWVAWPGPALAEFAEQFVAHNRMLSGGFEIDERMVTLADVTCPVLAFVGEVDEIAPAPSVRAVRRAAPRATIFETSLRAGHFGLVVGSKSREVTWPTVAAWCRWQDGVGDRPAAIAPLEDTDADQPGAPPLDLGYGMELVTNVGLGAVRSVAAAVAEGARSLRELADEAVEQLPRLIRLERVTRETRISLGLLLAEQARRAPDDTFFLFEARGYSYAAADRRIDNVVRGLLSVGVRQGEHVGVLMRTRPSALALVAALSRLGAVAVLLRPDGDLPRECELGQVGRIVTDPDHAADVAAATELPVLVLGGGGQPRQLAVDVLDMERIDPDTVEVPGWYDPNPGRAEDLAFVLFTGAGEHTRANRITNRRWSLSAFGTASAAALGPQDTVYGITPIHHPSGLLTGIGGAVAGGARLALAPRFDPATFWDEVRRYGVTVVSYTWAMCRDLVAAPTDPAEAHHPIRLFVGSGMPIGLWRRVRERFAPARVLEFYASTEGEAVLGNLPDEKVGAKGRPIPGSARVELARYEPSSGRLVEGPDGFVERCEVGEVGMLLAEVDRERGTLLTSPLRGVFATGDAWSRTGDLFRRDDDGDFWLVDSAAGVVHTDDGIVFRVPIVTALERMPAVELAVAYGVPVADGREVLVAAVTLRRKGRLDGDDLAVALGALAPAERPTVVRVVGDIPLTSWYRPRTAPLRRQGIPKASARRPVFVRDDDAYVPLDEDTRVGLRGS